MFFTLPCNFSRTDVHFRPSHCFKYSTTRKVKYYFEFTPAFRVGNITRTFRDIDTDKLPRKAREGVIEVSFPALQGASGAPVFIQGTNKLLGILSHNNDYYTTPEPIITLRDEEESTDKKGLYVIPHALAVHVKHLRKILEELSSNE